MPARTLLLLLLVLLCGTTAAQPIRPPNLVVILADDLGYGDLSSYGAPDLETPHVDALAAAGMRFEHFYANAPVCSPTRAALLTGRYPPFVGVPGVIRMHEEDSWGYLSPGAVLLPALLRAGGYDTALIGKWHLGLASPNLPNERGFDVFHGFLEGMMDDYDDHLRFGANWLRRDTAVIAPEGHATDLFTRWAVDYVRSRAGQEKPFFLYLAHAAPHVPLQPPAAWLERVRRRHPGLDERRAKLAAMIEQMDDGIGQVVQALREAGELDRTLLVFTSDNGGELPAARNGPWRGGKQGVYEGGLRVPAVVVWPGHVAPGSRTEALALTMDLFPTLLEAAGLPVPTALDGQSLVDVLGGAPGDSARTVFFTRREGNEHYGAKTIEAVRRGDWKLLQNSPFGPQELYHLRDDPYERHDLIEQERGVYRELAHLLREHLRKAGAVPWQPPDALDR